jgi:hypothetical protein
MSSQKYTITVVDSSSNQEIFTTVKTRYDSEHSLISSLAYKILHPQVTSIDFSKTNDEVHVRLFFCGGNAASARNLVYGSNFACER